MITISLCMIVKNEEDVLERCLTSVGQAADQIVIVDTGSTDRTREIALAFTDQVYDFPWIDDFSAARNFAFSKATKQYCLWLDADDVLEPEEREKLLRLKETLDPGTDVVMMRYNTAFDELDNPIFSFYRERLLRTGMFRWEGRVHEAIAVCGKVVRSDIAVSHRKLHPSDSGRNLLIYERQRDSGEPLNPRDQFYYARELYYHRRFERAAEEFEAFLDSGRGWRENNIEACRFLALCRDGLGQPEPALLALLRSFVYDMPRAEVCCDLGQKYLDKGDLPQAIFWYELALTRPFDPESGGFVLPDCYGYIPALQLCVCQDRLGDPLAAAAYNELAAAHKPGAEAVLYNRTYFAGRGLPEESVRSALREIEARFGRQTNIVNGGDKYPLPKESADSNMS
jgi:glycosyltransferase involved in cell wall biosynthesis